MTVWLELPFPPKELSPNARVGWREKARVVAQYREDCGWAGLEATSRYYSVAGRINVGPKGGRTLTPPVEADVVFVVPDRRKRDLDNLCASLKPAWDGLVDAGVLVGDDSTVFKVANVSLEVGEPCVKVCLRGVGP